MEAGDETAWEVAPTSRTGQRGQVRTFLIVLGLAQLAWLALIGWVVYVLV
jgi:hypothetical protein